MPDPVFPPPQIGLPATTPEEIAQFRERAHKAKYHNLLDKLVTDQVLPADYTPVEAGEALHGIAKIHGLSDQAAQQHAIMARSVSTPEPQWVSPESIEQKRRAGTLFGGTVNALQNIGHGAYNTTGQMAEFAAKMAGDEAGVQELQQNMQQGNVQFPDQGLAYKVGATAPFFAGGGLPSAFGKTAAAIGTTAAAGGGAAVERGADTLDALKAAGAEGLVGAGAMGLGRVLGRALPSATRAVPQIVRQGGIGAAEGATFGAAPIAGQLATGDQVNVNEAAEGMGAGALLGGLLRGGGAALGELRTRPTVPIVQPSPEPVTSSIEPVKAPVEQPISQPLSRPQMPPLEESQIRLDQNGRAAVSEATGASPVAETIPVIEKPQEIPNAGQVPRLETPVPQQGIRLGEGENARSQDIQRGSQEGPSSGNAQGGLTDLGVTEKGVKVQSNGSRLFLNGLDVGQDTASRRANMLKRGQAVGELRPAKETPVEETALPEGESKPIKASNEPADLVALDTETKLRHPDVQLAGISPQAAGEAVKGTVGLGRSVWGDMADRLRALGATDLGDKVATVSRRAKELVGQSAEKISNLAQGAASSSRIAGKAMEANANGRSTFLDAVEGRIAVPSGLQKAVNAVWEANRLTADWFRKVGLTRADGSPFIGFPEGKGMVRHWTPEFDAILERRYGDQARADLINDLAQRNKKTPDDIERVLSEGASLSDTTGTIRRDPMEFARALRDVPQYAKVNGKNLQILDLDPARYVKSLTNQASNRVAFGEAFGQKFDIGGDIEAQLKAQGITDPKILPAMADAVRALHGRDFGAQTSGVNRLLTKGQELKESALTPQVARQADRLVAAGTAITKTANLTASAVGNVTGVLGNAGTTSLTNLAKGIIQATVHPIQSGKAALAEGSVLPDLYRFHDTAGYPESVQAIINGTVGRVAHWANRWAALVSANAGRSWTEAMAGKQGQAAASDVVRLRALGFSTAEASSLASGNATPAQYQQVIREVVTATNAINATRAQQSVIQNYGIFRKYGPAFSTFAEQQMRNFTRISDIALDSKRPAGEQIAAMRMLGEKFLGLGTGGAGAVLAIAYLRGGSKGLAEETEKPIADQLKDYLFKGVIGGTGQAALTAMEKVSQPGPATAADLTRILSYPAGKALDFADYCSALGAEPSPVMSALFSQAPGAKIAKDLIGWASGDRTPARTMALQSYYKWAVKNPQFSGWTGGTNAPTALSLPVNKLAKALADSDKPRVRELLREAMEGMSATVTEKAAQGEVPKKIGPEMVGAALDARRALRGIFDVNTMSIFEGKEKAFVDLANSIGPTALNQLIMHDNTIAAYSDFLKE